MKPFYTHALLAVLLCISQSAIAQHLSASNYNLQRAPAFLENKGQVVDQNDHPRRDVKFIYDDNHGLKLILKENSFSYEVYTYEKQPKKNISEATGEPIDNHLPDKFKEPDPVTVKINRIDVELKGSNPHPEIISEGRSADYVNYYKEYTGENGITDIHYYSKVTYQNIYRNIDFVFLAKEDGSVKYNIIVHPGGRLSDVKMVYAGMKNISSSGNKIRIETALGGVEESIPLSYIQETGERVKVEYNAVGGKSGFEAENEKGTLVIDPIIYRWGTYYGGTNEDHSASLQADELSNVYLGGYTLSSDAIASANAYQTTYAGNYDAFLVKFNKNGARLWATYYGGRYRDFGSSVALSKKGAVYLAGWSTSPDIASTGAYKNNLGSQDSADDILVKFDTSGHRLWCTYYGGKGNEDWPYVAVDATGKEVYLAGSSSTSGIASTGAYQTFPKGYLDIFLVKFDENGNRSWCTFYGGSGVDQPGSIVTDNSGYIYIGGSTGSISGIATKGAYQDSIGSQWTSDALLVKFDNNGRPKWCTYYGGDWGELAYSMALDQYANIYLTGETFSQMGIATPDAFKTSNPNHNLYGFLVKFDSSGSRKWGTYYSGNSTQNGLIPYAVAIDALQNVWISGTTSHGSGLATSDAYQASISDGFIAEFNANGSRLWGSYFRGVFSSLATDLSGNIYMAGFGDSGIASVGAYQTIMGGAGDAFLVKFTDAMPDVGMLAIDSLQASLCGAHQSNVYVRTRNFSDTINLDSFFVGWSVDNAIQKPIKYSKLSFGDTSQDINLGSYFFSAGIHNIKVWTYDPNGKRDGDVTNDTMNITVQVYPRSQPNFSAKPVCYGDTSHFSNKSTITGGTIKSYLWKLGDGTTDTAQNPSHLYSSAGSYKVTLYTTTEFGCTDSTSDTVKVYGIPKAYVRDTSLCAGKAFPLIANVTDAAEFRWYVNDSFISDDSILWQTYTTPGKYKVALAVKNYNGCSDSVHAVITILPVPVFAATVHAISDSARFVVNDSSSSDTYFWDFGDGNTSTDRNAVHVYPKDSLYSVKLTVTNKQGCQSFYTQQLGIHTGIVPIIFPSMKLMLYPNPAQDKLTIRCTGENCEERLHLSIISMDGKTLLQDDWKGEELHSVNVSALCPGSYLVRINNGKEQSVQSLIKE